MTRYLHVLALTLLAGLLGACGTPGAPMPPSLELPLPPQDLAATRKGSKVTLAWTPPSQTTDGQNVRTKYLGPTVVCEAINDFPAARCVEKVGELPASAPRLGEKRGRKPAPLAPGTPKSEYTVALPDKLQQQYPTGWATFAVEPQNSHGRSAGLSSQVRVPLAPTIDPPTSVRAEVTAHGIEVLAAAKEQPGNASLHFSFHVYRKPAGNGDAVDLGEASAFASGLNVYPKFVDQTFEWEKTYEYWITPVTTVRQNGGTIAEVVGDDSPHVTVFAHDVFPPAVPGGLEAVASGVGQKPFSDLTWAPSGDADLAGYNVYRQEQGAATWTKINTGLVPTPSFRDETVAPGHTYNYAVSAVDLRGNESAKSEPASESLP